MRPDAAVLALLGDVRMSQGDLHARSLALQQRIDHVVQEVMQLWSHLPVQNDAPDIIGQVSEYLDNTDKTRQAAQDDFRWAAKNYEAAIQRVGGKRRWAYQLQIAGAYAGLYRLSGSDENRQKGVDALDSLGDEEASPLIRTPAAHLRKLLAGAPPEPAPGTP